MKIIASVSLIICGTIITLVPYVHSSIAMAMMSKILVSNDGRHANINTTLPDWYDGWCFALGLFVILSGLYSTFRLPSESGSRKS